MKISYIFQLKDFLTIFTFGVSIGLVLNIFEILRVFKKNIFLKIISELFCTILIFFTFIFAINRINAGEMRLFLIIGYILGITLEKITLGKLFAKLAIIVYNYLKLIVNKFKKSKLGQLIFK